MKHKLILIVVLLIFVGAGVVVFAYSKTWGKVELEVKIHINEELVQLSEFGESPTFAIWLENQQTQQSKTIFVTRRASENDWEGKAEVPVALPYWFQIQNMSSTNSDKSTVDVITGATPKPGYFTVNANLPEGSKWNCWMEVNLSGDFNDTYKEIDLESMKEDEFMSGQPALLYKSDIVAQVGKSYVPEIEGMSILDENEIIQPLIGITTAKDIFDEITLTINKSKPKILAK